MCYADQLNGQVRLPHKVQVRARGPDAGGMRSWLPGQQRGVPHHRMRGRGVRAKPRPTVHPDGRRLVA